MTRSPASTFRSNMASSTSDISWVSKDRKRRMFLTASPSRFLCSSDLGYIICFSSSSSSSGSYCSANTDFLRPNELFTGGSVVVFRVYDEKEKERERERKKERKRNRNELVRTEEKKDEVGESESKKKVMSTSQVSSLLMFLPRQSIMFDLDRRRMEEFLLWKNNGEARKNRREKERKKWKENDDGMSTLVKIVVVWTFQIRA